MSDPAWLPGLVAVITLAITAYCLSRLIAGRVRRRPTDVDVDAAHALMGVGMAAMLVPSLSPVPAVTWAWVFAVVAVWLAWRIARVYRNGTDARLAQAHYVPHLVMSVAMIYMGATASSATTGGSAGGGTAMGGPGAGTAGFPPLTLVLALSTVLSTDMSDSRCSCSGTSSGCWTSCRPSPRCEPGEPLRNSRWHRPRESRARPSR